MLTKEDKMWIKRQLDESEKRIKSEVSSEGLGCLGWAMLFFIFVNAVK